MMYSSPAEEEEVRSMRRVFIIGGVLAVSLIVLSAFVAALLQGSVIEASGGAYVYDITQREGAGFATFFWSINATQSVVGMNDTNITIRGHTHIQTNMTDDASYVSERIRNESIKKLNSINATETVVPKLTTNTLFQKIISLQ